MECDRRIWSNPVHGALDVLASTTIKLALTSGTLAKQDLWSGNTDQAFWTNLVNSSDDRVRRAASKVRVDIVVQEILPTDLVTHEEGKCEVFEREWKAQIIDPDVVTQWEDELPLSTCRLSELDQGFAKVSEDYVATKCGIKRYFVLRVMFFSAVSDALGADIRLPGLDHIHSLMT